MRGENLINIEIQNRIIAKLEENNAYCKNSAIDLNVRKGINFTFLCKKNVIVKYNDKYYLDVDNYNQFRKRIIRRGFPF